MVEENQVSGIKREYLRMVLNMMNLKCLGNIVVEQSRWLEILM